ncbi:MAG: aminopeptidase [Candidatus Binataceae bacterium]
MLAALLVLGCVLLSGCDVSYIAHAAYEESILLWRRKPISQVLARQNLPAVTRGKLETVLAVRQFAAERLGENVGGAYKTVTPVDSGAVVWVVMAAKRDKLVAHTWWFPIVGSVPYRGYFKRREAEAEAASMEARGYDTYVRPAIAFSSLGFFNDPLLANLLELNRVELAGVIIHELFHRTFFLSSDVMFDESAATWVGARGALAFFTETEGAESADAVAARGVLESELRFGDFLQQEQARLLRLYASGLPRDEILKRRVKLFADISADYARLKPTLSGLERYNLDRQKLNNAVLLNYLIYFHDLRNFEALYRIHHQDLRGTIQAIITLAKSDRADPFHAIWAASLAAPPVKAPSSVKIPFPQPIPAD